MITVFQLNSFMLFYTIIHNLSKWYFWQEENTMSWNCCMRRDTKHLQTLLSHVKLKQWTELSLELLLYVSCQHYTGDPKNNLRIFKLQEREMFVYIKTSPCCIIHTILQVCVHGLCLTRILIKREQDFLSKGATACVGATHQCSHFTPFFIMFLTSYKPYQRDILGNSKHDI